LNELLISYIVLKWCILSAGEDNFEAFRQERGE
jgi:hypothetical protein